MNLSDVTTDELVTELQSRKKVEFVHIPKDQIFKIKRCVVDDVSIQWFDAVHGDGKANILVVKE